MNAGLPFVYLASLPYSGSTLLSFLINSHPQIATVGEMTGPNHWQDPETYLCSCGQPIRQCSFWHEVAAAMQSRGYDFDPGHFNTRMQLGHHRYVRRILSGSLGNSLVEDLRDVVLRPWSSRSRQLSELIERYEVLASAILAVTGKSVFFDASKNHMAIRYLSRSAAVDLRVVHLVRDVRGASLSKKKNRQVSWSRAVNSWVRGNQNIERQLRRLPADRWIRVRYEDLCREPDRTMSRLFEFCGVKPYTVTSAASSQEHHIVGNRMRLRNAREISLDEGWREAVTPDELQCAMALAGRLHQKYGYAPMSTTDLRADFADSLQHP